MEKPLVYSVSAIRALGVFPQGKTLMDFARDGVKAIHTQLAYLQEVEDAANASRRLLGEELKGLFKVITALTPEGEVPYMGVPPLKTPAAEAQSPVELVAPVEPFFLEEHVSPMGAPPVGVEPPLPPASLGPLLDGIEEGAATPGVGSGVDLPPKLGIEIGSDVDLPASPKAHSTTQWAEPTAWDRAKEFVEGLPVGDRFTAGLFKAHLFPMPKHTRTPGYSVLQSQTAIGYLNRLQVTRDIRYDVDKGVFTRLGPTTPVAPPVAKVSAPVVGAATAPTGVDDKDPKTGRRLGPTSPHGAYPNGLHKTTRDLLDFLREAPEVETSIDEVQKWLAARNTPSKNLRHLAGNTLSSLTEFRCLKRTGRGKYEVIPYVPAVGGQATLPIPPPVVEPPPAVEPPVQEPIEEGSTEPDVGHMPQLHRGLPSWLARRT